jgi:hypothetical protein
MFWGTGDRLPWFGRYERDANDWTQGIIHVSKEILQTRTVAERGPLIGESHQFELDEDENIVQFLTAESLLAIEGLLDSLFSGSPFRALAWQHAAFANLTEAGTSAQALLERRPSGSGLH